MDTIIVFAIGSLAVGYLGYVLWKGVSGKSSCSCGGSATCSNNKKGRSCCSHK